MARRSEPVMDLFISAGIIHRQNKDECDQKQYPCFNRL